MLSVRGSRPPDDCPDCPEGGYCDECSLLISPSVKMDPIDELGCGCLVIFVVIMLIKEIVTGLL